MNKRLLLISSNSSGRGGGERYLVYLTQGLHHLNCEVHVLLSTVSYMNDWAAALSAEGAIVHRKNLLGLRHRPLRFVQSLMDKNQISAIAKICKEITPNAILVNQQYDEDGLDYLAGALMADLAPVGGTMHMPMTANKHQRPLGNWRGKLLSRWYKKHPYSLILTSAGGQQEFESYYPSPRPTHLVHYGCPFASRLDLSRVESSASPLPKCWPESWIDRVPTIGFVGQLVSQKNVDLLIEAWIWMRQQGINARLLLIGDGPEKQRLQQKLRQCQWADAWFMAGWQPVLDQFFSQIDVYAMTSHFEGLPLALVEAVGNGIPTVITDFNGAIDVAKLASWVSVAPARTPEAVGAALIQTIQNNAALKQQARAGQAGFQSYFSVKRMAIETLTALGICSDY